MRCVYWLSIMLVLASGDLVRADEQPRRTTRVASGPVRPAPEEAPQKAQLTPKLTTVPPVTRPSHARPTLLEPSSLVEGVGLGMVACFQVLQEAEVGITVATDNQVTSHLPIEQYRPEGKVAA